jgi:hypothetical protein
VTDPIATTISVGAQEIVAQAQNLGLTWILRPATVTDSSPLMIRYDGDTVDTTPVNMTGRVLAVGRRVMGLLIPPSGNFVAGFYGEDQGYPVMLVDLISSVTPSAAIGAETTVLTLPSAVYRSERAYMIEFRTDVISSTGTNNNQWRVRRTNVAGTIMGTGVWAPRSSAAGSNDFGSDVVIRNNTAFDVTDTMVLTYNVAGAGTITMNAGATQVAYMRRYDIGPADSFPNAPTL